MAGVSFKLAYREDVQPEAAISLFDQFDIQPTQQRNRLRQRKLCLFEYVQTGIDGIVAGVREVGLGQIGVDKPALEKIRLGAISLGQVGV